MTLVMRIRQGVWVDVDFLSIVWDGEVGLGGCIYRVQDFDCLEAGVEGEVAGVVSDQREDRGPVGGGATYLGENGSCPVKGAWWSCS